MLPIRFHHEEYDRLNRYAIAKERTKSDILRELVRALPEVTDEEVERAGKQKRKGEPPA